MKCANLCFFLVMFSFLSVCQTERLLFSTFHLYNERMKPIISIIFPSHTLPPNDVMTPEMPPECFYQSSVASRAGQPAGNIISRREGRAVLPGQLNNAWDTPGLTNLLTPLILSTEYFQSQQFICKQGWTLSGR